VAGNQRVVDRPIECARAGTGKWGQGHLGPMACSYCYVPDARATPIRSPSSPTSTRSPATSNATPPGRAAKPQPNRCDPVDWVYDIGENSDCSVDALSDNVRDLVGLFARIVRCSLMPESASRLVDIRTSKASDRIAALDDFVEAGFEVHLNLSPVIV
jgi:spore photoproduct lyase